MDGELSLKGMMSSCSARSFLADKAVYATGVNKRTTVTVMWNAQVHA